jgi:putative lipoprotein
MDTKRLSMGRAAVWAVALTVAAAVAVTMSAQASDAERLVGPVWLAEDIGGGGVIDNVQTTVKFEPAGKVTGSGGCNRLFGTAKAGGNSLAFGGIGTTRMACLPAVMRQESKFLDALAGTRTFRFTGGQLRFYDAAGAELVRFTQR